MKMIKEIKKSKLRMLVLSHTSSLGGAELSLLEHLKALSSKKDIYVILPKNGPIITFLKKFVKEIYVVPFFWWCAKGLKLIPYSISNALNLVSLLLVSRIIIKVKPDICWTNTITPPPILGMICKLLNIPHIWFIHEFGKEDHGLSFIIGEKLGYNIIARLSKAIFVNSMAVGRKFLRFTYWRKVPMYVIDYIVETPLHIPTIKRTCGKKQNNEHIRIVHAGVIKQGKGQEDLIHALSILRDKIKFICYIVGAIEDKEYYRRIKHIIAENGLEKSIVFTGYLPREGVLYLMKNSDIIVICSRSEAFGRVVVESMKLGKAVIATRRGGIVEIIQDGENGLLYEPNDVEELAQKIMLLACDSRLREMLGEKAKQYALKRFNEERISKHLLKIIKRVVSENINA
jgi:glycosyltransferase involved in cell wall biosynthesis